MRRNNADADRAAGQLGPMLSAPEAKEDFTAFFEKRKPDFTKFA